MLSLYNLFDFKDNHLLLNETYIDFLGFIEDKWLINIRTYLLDIDINTYISPVEGFKLNTPQIPLRVFA